MKKLFKILSILIAIIVVVFIGLSLFVKTLDADKYRPRLIAEMSARTGRTVKLDGPIAFSLGFSGVTISVQDASIGNPSWASRPTMAGMGKFDISVGLLPLLSHRISVNEMAIENADILLETNAAGQHNWNFTPASPDAAKPDIAKKPVVAAPSQASENSLAIDNLSITNSQLSMRAADGKISSYNVASLKLGMGVTGAQLKFTGDINNVPLVITVKTSLTDLLSQTPFTFDADTTYGVIHLIAQGTADLGGSKAEIANYEVSSGKTKFSGKLSAMWNGPRPVLRGTLSGDYINMADFKTDAAGGSEPAAAAEKADGRPKRMFSDAPLPFDGLKAADADLVATIGEFPVGKGALKKISAKLMLAGGVMTLAPVKANIGDATANVEVRLNAAQSPAHLNLSIVADGVDLGDLQRLGSMTPFMTGKAGANIQLGGDGNSAHDIVSNLSGVIVITAQKGEVLTGAAAGISSTLAELFNPKGGNDAINCLAARFIVKNGIMNDNGLLIDSSATTVAGKGNVNLGKETVNLTLRAKTKLVDVGGLVPAVQVTGPLSSPGYSVDAVGTVTSVVGSLMNGNANVLASSVPEIQAAPANQNACVYTLDHPKAAASSSILPAGVSGKAGQAIQNLGNAVKGLFGK